MTKQIKSASLNYKIIKTPRRYEFQNSNWLTNWSNDSNCFLFLSTILIFFLHISIKTVIWRYHTCNFDSCSRVCRSRVCIRSSASSNDEKIVSFSMTEVWSRFSSSFFAFVIIFSSSLRLSKPLMWFCCKWKRNLL